MAFSRANLVQEVTTTQGLGPYVLDGVASPLLRTFAEGNANGSTVRYLVTGASNAEICEGILDSSGSPHTLTRATLIVSTTGAFVSWGAGQRTIAQVLTAEEFDALRADIDGKAASNHNHSGTYQPAAQVLTDTTAPYTTAEQAKVGYLSVTQAVDLDAIETRVNALDAAVVLKGVWDASAGTFPGSGSAQAGESWIVSVAGTVNSVAFVINDRIIAIADNASTTTFAANWFKADYTDVFQTNAEIETAYNAQVSAVSQADAEAGTSTTVTRWTAQRVAQAIAAQHPIESLIIPCSDETTAITTGTAKITFRMPYAFTLTEIPRASATTAPTGSVATFDINEDGASILSTKITIDASEKTSTTAATPAVLSDSALANDAEMTIDFDGVGSTIAGAGIKITLIGRRT